MATREVDYESDLICFQCGEKHTGSYEESFYIQQCDHCHNISVLSVTSAFDILNDLYLKRRWNPLKHLVKNPAREIEELDFDK